MWKRNCPDCGEELTYEWKCYKDSADLLNSCCKSCSKTGNKNPMKGIKHPKGGKTLDEYYGIDRANEIRKKLKQSHLGQVAWNKGMKNPYSPETLRQMRLGTLKELENKHGKLYPNYSHYACKLFNDIMEQKNVFIQHAENVGEYHIKELGYWVDGYDKENNIVYEFDEKYHQYNPEKHNRRQKEIEDFLGCKFIRIKDERVILRG